MTGFQYQIYHTETRKKILMCYLILLHSILRLLVKYGSLRVTAKCLRCVTPGEVSPYYLATALLGLQAYLELDGNVPAIMSFDSFGLLHPSRPTSPILARGPLSLLELPTSIRGSYRCNISYLLTSNILYDHSCIC